MVSRFAGIGDPEPLTGPIEICATEHESIRYSIPPIQNAAAYYWNVPDLFDLHGEITTPTPYIDLPVTSAGSGDIRVYGMDQCLGKTDSAILSIEAHEALPTPVLTINDCDKEIMVKGEGNFDWYVNGTHSPALHGDHLIVSDSGTYYVEVNNFCGIQQSNSVTAHPVFPSNLSLPNVITPNSDGDNDFFQLDKALKNSSIKITNRWGHEIYSSPRYQNNWSAEGLSPGHYFYILHNQCLSSPYKGTIHVIR
jgi:gliding motility-associated-like protein